MRTERLLLFAITTIACMASAFGEKPRGNSFQPVEKKVRKQSGFEVRWQQNAKAREENLNTVRALLKKPLSKKSAIQIALLNNRALLATFEDVGVSAADLQEAGLWKNPGIDLSMRFPDRGPARAAHEAGVLFDVLDLMMIPLRKRVAAEQLEAVQLRVSDAVLRLIGEVRQTIIALQADEALLAQRASIVEMNGLALELAQRQHEAGNITDLELAKKQAAYQAARLEFVQRENEQRQHREELNRLLGLWGKDTRWKIAKDLPALPEKEITLSGLESLAIQQRLDLAAAHRELASVISALGLTKSYRYIGVLEFGMTTERESNRTYKTGPALHLELPLFNRGEARIAKGEAELRRAERKLEAIAIDIRSNIRELHDRLTAQRETARFYRDEILPLRKEITAGMLLHYNGMLAGNYDLFATRIEEIEAEEMSVTALRDYWLTRAELERAVGGNLEIRRTKETKKN